MATNVFDSYKNYITIANANRNNVSLYFYIKNFCFRKMISLVNTNKNLFTPEETSLIQNDLQNFKAETGNVNIPPVSKEAFCEFLERLYSQFNFEIPEIKTFQLCRDITEILTIYGPLDNLGIQRMDYFNKKIEMIKNLNSPNAINPNIDSNKPKMQPLGDQSKNNIHNKVPSHTQSNNQIHRDEDGDFANKLLTTSVASDIQQIKLSATDYMPKKINKNLKFPVKKNSSDYKLVKDEIISNIEDGICELEYFNIDHAKDHVECALYYLKNIHENN